MIQFVSTSCPVLSRVSVSDASKPRRSLSHQIQGEASTLGRRSEDGMADVSVDTMMEAEDSQGPGVGDTDSDEMDMRQDEVSGDLHSQA